MTFNGEIKVSGPGLLEKLARESVVFQSDDELILSVSDQKKEEKNFSIWVNVQDDRHVSFGTCVDDEFMVDDFFYFRIQDEEGQSIGIQMNLAQVRALSKLLQSYVSAYDNLENSKGQSVDST